MNVSQNNSTAAVLTMHANYAGLVEKASLSHQSFRDPKNISPNDVVHVHLYAYAFRRHVIGAFDATRKALADIPIADRFAAVCRKRAIESLGDLGNQAMSVVPSDFRVVIDTFYRTHRKISQVIESLNAEYEVFPHSVLAVVKERFRKSMKRITSGNGIDLTQDTSAPDQECFVVPNLGITIVPLVYGDNHSWNLAYLSGANRDVPLHAHRCGVEIHLGFNPTHGETILGDTRTQVSEGYAMPIPPNIVHGWQNHSDSLHHVPFIFGSLAYGGWGVFLDVEPQQSNAATLALVAQNHNQFKHMIHLERSIVTAEKLSQSQRTVLIPSQVTCREGSGGLELAITRVTSNGFTFATDDFRAVSVVRGAGHLAIEGVTQQIAVHDHFGIPAGMKANVQQVGNESLVLLDSVIRNI